jgi:hypothetical protein
MPSEIQLSANGQLLHGVRYQSRQRFDEAPLLRLNVFITQ